MNMIYVAVSVDDDDVWRLLVDTDLSRIQSKCEAVMNEPLFWRGLESPFFNKDRGGILETKGQVDGYVEGLWTIYERELDIPLNTLPKDLAS